MRLLRGQLRSKLRRPLLLGDAFLLYGAEDGIHAFCQLLVGYKETHRGN